MLVLDTSIQRQSLNPRVKPEGDNEGDANRPDAIPHCPNVIPHLMRDPAPFSDA